MRNGVDLLSFSKLDRFMEINKFTTHQKWSSLRKIVIKITFLDSRDENGAATFSTTTFRKMTLSITTLSTY
jgi:hypothetical protein